ncbi:drug resistance transporter, EmrB/QacA subfamily [Pseudonocardia ammonioxydans]|uniref:Drug resistance transporter, EmrB/QacA subfamily n=1 Tax=Pseudonocardia ammonioxydans TaxID=260086 RepID=A0A1I5F9D2_PSUAM|nr:MFS transporter [Pseudonocardia ammonioxydans]SFO20367.1 drug resistance transporter, EmrB/QacA subfamily [Pseudonocardia ammonioxydans]
MTSTTRATRAPEEAAAHRRDVLIPLTGLLMALFVGVLSSTIVSNALPRILGDLGGTQAEYTWVVSASLLAMTASTPIWGKLADLYSKKVLVQAAIGIFLIGSLLCGLAVSTSQLIGFRVLQGLGMGGLQSLAQVVIAAIITPRERGRYMGYLSAIMSLAVVGGPLLGGVIVDSPLGWRWCFFVGVPLAAIALVVLQRTLNLPTAPRDDVSIDYLGALVIAAGVSALLLWTSLAGKEFAWGSPTSIGLVVAGVLLLGLAVVVERRAKEPVVPPFLFRDRTFVLATVASLFVGVAMFGSTIFLSQYFQLARGATATEAGVMTLPMIVGMFVASNVAGQLISRYGRWKRYLVTGGASLVAGLTLAAVIVSSTVPYWQVAIAMLLVGTGVGMTQQNLVLAVQNTVALRNMGAASSTVTFFRSLGGSAGVAGLGALLASVVASRTSSGLAAAGIDGGGATAGGQVPNLAELPEPVRSIVMDSYGHAIADIFLVAAPLAALALIAIVFLRERPLRDTIDIEPGDIEPGTGPGTPAGASPGTGTHSTGAHGRTGADRTAAAAGTAPVLHGIVRADGAPAAGAVLTVLDRDGTELARTRADDDGHYRICVATGTVSTVYRWEGRPAAHRVTVPQEGMRLDVDLEPLPGPARPEIVSVGEPATRGVAFPEAVAPGTVLPGTAGRTNTGADRG